MKIKNHGDFAKAIAKEINPKKRDKISYFLVRMGYSIRIEESLQTHPFFQVKFALKKGVEPTVEDVKKVAKAINGRNHTPTN